MNNDLLYRIAPHNMGSNSAALLQAALSELTGSTVLRVFPDRAYRQREHHRVINWGRMVPPNWHDEELYENVVNSYESVRVAGCKQLSLEAFNAHGVEMPEFGDVEWAYNIIARGGSVYARNVLRGHGGEGIEVISSLPEIVNHPAKLFVQALDTHKEYRVHVIDGEVVHLQEKRRRRSRIDEDSIDYDIRNNEGGWVYCIQNVDPSESVIHNSIAAVEAVGAVFGAVDVVMLEDGSASVLEVNTAPGLCNQTAEIYANKLVNYFNKE